MPAIILEICGHLPPTPTAIVFETLEIMLGELKWGTRVARVDTMGTVWKGTSAVLKTVTTLKMGGLHDI